MDSSLIALRGVTKRYREGEFDRCVLDALDFTVEAGEAVAVVGPSGSGKSTLLNLIGAMETPDAGSIAVAGAALADLNETGRTRFRRQHLGFIFQQLNLVPTLSVLENLLLPLELNHVLDREGRRRAVELLERVGLADRAASFPERLSGGERQRVAVARALIHRPALLLADEPTGSLDAETAQVVLDLFDGLRRERAMTAILATHSSDVASRAERVVEIRAGRLREVGAV